ncbi:MAG: hypothetical protein LBD79_00535 [Treponema sp.]|jgi:hypothetical protein|nr:hypothetical protein [Treponema sp.]
MSEKQDFRIVDRPSGVEQTENGKDVDVMEALLSGKAIQKSVQTSRGRFTILYTTGRDRLRIDRYKAIRRSGIRVDAFDEYAEYNNNVWSTLDIVVVDGPDWYKQAKEKNPRWSWEEVPDEELIVELFDMVKSFRAEITERIRGSGIGKAAGESELSAAQAPVDDGTFSGLAYGRPGAKG